MVWADQPVNPFSDRAGVAEDRRGGDQDDVQRRQNTQRQSIQSG